MMIVRIREFSPKSMFRRMKELKMRNTSNAQAFKKVGGENPVSKVHHFLLKKTRCCPNFARFREPNDLVIGFHDDQKLAGTRGGFSVPVLSSTRSLKCRNMSSAFTAILHPQFSARKI